MLIDEKLDELYDKKKEVELRLLYLNKEEFELLIEKNELLKLKGSNNERAKNSGVKEEAIRKNHGISSSKT